MSYIKIASTTAGTGVTEFNFNSIPSAYTDLKLVLSMNGTSDILVTFNGTSNNFTYRSIWADGSNVYSFSGTDAYMKPQYPASPSNTFSNMELYIPNYLGSNKKSISLDNVNEANATTAYIIPMAYIWDNTASISSIKVQITSGITQYSSAYLYGIKSS
jgi:hypothetical protein